MLGDEANRVRRLPQRIMSFDLVLVLGAGRIIEYGAPEHLLAEAQQQQEATGSDAKASRGDAYGQGLAGLLACVRT